jgi:diguanylate cyclase (GGDEF)-like protein/PAS domain S-box-containing protein
VSIVDRSHKGSRMNDRPKKPKSLRPARSSTRQRPAKRAHTGGRGELQRLHRILQQLRDDRALARKALHESEERYRIVADSASDAIFTIDEHSTIVFANPATERLFGYPVAGLIGQNLTTLMPPELRAAHLASVANYLVHCERRIDWQGIELRGLHRDGHEIPIEVSFGEFHHDGRHLFTGVVRDVSARQKANQFRLGQSRVLELIATAAPLTQVLTELVRLIETQADGMLCSILLLDDSGRRVRHGAAPSLPPAYVQAIDGAAIGPQAGSCGTAIYRNEQVIVTDTSTDPLWADYRELAATFDLRACWSTPIRSRHGMVLGSFAMYYREVRAPSAAEHQLIEIATQIAGVAIEREQTDATLRERESRIRRLVDSNIIGVLFWSANGKIWDANDAFLNMIGCSREELNAGRIRWGDITPPEYHALDEHALEEITRTGGCTPYEKEYLRRDGSRVPVMIGGATFEGARERGVAFVLDLSERKRAEARIHHMAQHDALTGLANRELFRDRVGQAISQAHRDRRQVAVLFIDLDHFKDVNDSLGHPVGDRLLQAVARRLQRCLREGDSVARLGGDEFVVCLPALTDPQDAAPVAGKMLDSLRRGFRVGTHELHVTGSVGISLYPENGKDADALMRTADTAMYYAKDKGRDNYQFFIPRLNEAAQRRLTIASRLRRALQRGEFELHYQPQTDLMSGRMFSAEALLRWHPRDMDPVGPAEFIKIAEETGLIAPLGEWVLRQACQQLRRWRAAGFEDFRVTVNLSPHQLRRPGFPELAGRILEEAGVPAPAVEIEITEGLLMMYSQENVTALGRLARMGMRLAVDDFGTGYSSLAYLQRFPISVLKIDRSFVSGIGMDPNDTAIVSAIIAMAESLQLKVVAEGVETADQAAFLKSHGCFAAQGYYYSKALPAEQFSELLGSSVAATAAG